jgi:hypothetical protein
VVDYQIGYGAADDVGQHFTSLAYNSSDAMCAKSLDNLRLPCPVCTSIGKLLTVRN